MTVAPPMNADPMNTDPGDLVFSFATTDDADAVVALVQSAYRGEASRAGWTTEAG